MTVVGEGLTTPIWNLALRLSRTNYSGKNWT